MKLKYIDSENEYRGKRVALYCWETSYIPETTPKVQNSHVWHLLWWTPAAEWIKNIRAKYSSIDTLPCATS
jgi:hypothetical protein